ncbi:copper chaperone PCu(A)C [Defluviimonas sp. SAOS-178_SWC]|uniref:copper chaperone PCu(A)C n=1 Tax=Defluviimonas sp. SAOS-178_SWC TaxID=3121287 RepID=UPI0032215757
MTYLKSGLAAVAVAALFPIFSGPALAADTITVTDAYARFMPGAKAGAAFMTIENSGDADDQLVDVASDIAMKVELHTHKAGTDGTMQMIHVPEGFPIPAHGQHMLQRGGDHVMFMGLNERPAEGATVHLTLTFEKAGTVEVDVPVDSAR